MGIQQETGETLAQIPAYLRAPIFPLRTPLLQAGLTTRRPRDVGVMASYDGAFLVEAGPDESDVRSAQNVRLLAYYTPAHTGSAAVPAEPKGLVILLHGWEGSSHSILNLVMGTALVGAGYDVIQLNLRDHGPMTWLDPVGLNEGMFLGTLLAETRRAVATLAGMARSGPVFLVGASLGGNYALRIASKSHVAPLPDLTHVIAISPVLNPGRTVDLVDGARPFRRYFRSRWLRSVQRKAACFSHRYDVRGLERLSRIRPMTEWLVRRYTKFDSADEYFAAYAYLDEASAGLALPTTVIAAADDPVIPVSDVRNLADSPLLTRRILDWGGHVGLVQWPPLRHGMPTLVLDILSAAH